MQIIGFKEYQKPAKRLANNLALEYTEVTIHHFPDGESKLTLPNTLDREIILCRSLNQPNSKLVELFLTCRAARQRGVEHITLVAPYLCYMRQDIAFNPGEIVSQKIIGQWLGELFDRIITVDPHLHRIKNLNQAIPNARANSLSATSLMADFLNQQSKPPILLGPDGESVQWVKQIAKQNKLEWAVASKQRRGDHDVDIVLPEINFGIQPVVIVDDVASTGHTIAQAAKALKQRGVQTVDCLVTHPLFADGAEQQLSTYIDHIWSTDSITHHSNVIQLAPLLADALRL
ncbi:MAG TPA: ribose-phosphate diphosphokinase [Gammaproteobacteria bacterium]|nr:ribose-phosphate diphosphokinase [Gammaproteobacteria bacterium]